MRERVLLKRMSLRLRVQKKMKGRSLPQMTRLHPGREWIPLRLVFSLLSWREIVRSKKKKNFQKKLGFSDCMKREGRPEKTLLDHAHAETQKNSSA